jgi:predicted AAA+ superfamily ATPase
MNNYIKRLLENDILENSKSFPVILVCGPRQVGKTTILNKLSNKKINYVTLDDPLIRKLAKEDPALFLENNKPPLIIDEIQYATELLPYIKIQVDKARLNALQNNSDSNGQYYLTGSQMFTLMQNVSESLAGRVGIIDMYGLSYSEIIGKDQDYFLPTKSRCEKRENNKRPETLEVFEKIIRGSFPALYQDENISTEKFYSSYLRTYLERDIRDLVTIKEETKFLTFMSALAARTGQELNYDNIAKDAEIDNKTAKNWISYLRTSGLIFLLQPYSNNPTTRAIKTPKMYFTDTGLACYLAGYSDAKTLEKSAINGNMFETYVIMEIVKSFVNDNKDPRLYLNFYRDSNQIEIDLIITINNTVYPIEIKKSKNPDKNMIKNFKILNKGEKQIGEGGVICMVDKILPLDNNNLAIPIQCI